MTEQVTNTPAPADADPPTEQIPVVRGPQHAAEPEQIAAAPEDDDDVLVSEWERPRRINRLTWILLAAILAVLAFAGGAAVQKIHDAALGGGSAARARAAGGFGGTGGAAGGTGGGAGRTAAAGAGAGAADAGGTEAGGGAGAAATPVVVGTLSAVGPNTLTVTDFAGTAVIVHIPASATVTSPGLAGPKVGSPVSVTGTKAADGSVTATAVTVRSAGG